MARSKLITSRIMSAIKSKNTKPELALRRALRRKGYRFRNNYKELPGTPDIVFLKEKLVIFVDGDFWHGHNWRLRRLKSRAAEFSREKRKYWTKKISTNIKRDRKVSKKLRVLGFHVLRFWESDVKKEILPIIFKIENKLQSLKPS